ncbi:MAG: hypothetical protein IMY72_11685 [Bacteroidetes bacterium]|nr:hypothetical protein [Bacteroidota bacterium]
MNLKKIIIQNWDNKTQQELYTHIISNVLDNFSCISNKDITDVAIVGSRIGNWSLEKSDIDVVVFISENIICPNPKITYFKNIRTCTFIRHGDIYTDKKVYGKFHMPRFSLKTKEYIKGNEEDIEEYLKWKFKIKKR